MHFLLLQLVLQPLVGFGLHIMYFTFYIYCPVWVKFLARHLHIMLSSFCELCAVQLRVGHILFWVSVKLRRHMYIENVCFLKLKKALVKSGYFVTKYTFCSLVWCLCCQFTFFLFDSYLSWGLDLVWLHCYIVIWC